jgi:hypothetical protein
MNYWDIIVNFFFFLRKGWYINSPNLQKGPETKEKLQGSPLDPDDDDEPELTMARRCWSSPNIGSPEPTTPQTGSHRAPPPKRLLPGTPAPPRRTSVSSTYWTASRSTAYLDLAVVQGKSHAGRWSPRELHRRRGSARTTDEPTAPPPPKRRRPDTCQALPWIHAVRRASPTLPPPEQPTEGREPTPHRRKRWTGGGLSKSPLRSVSGRGKGGRRSVDNI